MKNQVLLLSFILIIIASCGNPLSTVVEIIKPDMKTVYHDPQFTPYRDKFESITGLPSTHVNITLVWGMSPEIAGMCTMYSWFPEDNYIEINADYWEHIKDDPDTIEPLIFHELTHCVILRHEHIEGTLPDGCQLSIMDPTAPVADCYVKHKEFYIEGILQLIRRN